jgi:hypothetical protein
LPHFDAEGHPCVTGWWTKRNKKGKMIQTYAVKKFMLRSTDYNRLIPERYKLQKVVLLTKSSFETKLSNKGKPESEWTSKDSSFPLYLTGWEWGVTQLQLSIEICFISDRGGTSLKKLTTLGKSQSCFDSQNCWNWSSIGPKR